MKKINDKPISTLEEWDCGRFDHAAAVKEVDNLLENSRLMFECCSTGSSSECKKIREHNQDIVKRIYDPCHFAAHRLVNVFTMFGPMSKIEHGNVEEDIAAYTRMMKVVLYPDTVNNWAKIHEASREYIDVISLELKMEILREITVDLRNNVGHLFSEKFRNTAQIRNVFSKVITKMQAKTGVAPNWIVTSPEIADSLNDQSPLRCRFIEGASVFEHSLGINPSWIVRIDDKDLLVFTDPLFPISEMLFGYKGTKKHPSPYYYAPYVPLTLTPKAENRHGILNRYAKRLMRGGAAYYGKLIIDNVEGLTGGCK